MAQTPETPEPTAPGDAGAPPGVVASAPGGIGGWFANQIANLGAFAMDRVVAIGDVALFAIKTVGWIFARRQRREVLLPAFYQIGVMSLPVVALTGLFIGMVLAVQSYAQFKAIGLETRLGSVINLSLVRELGPVLAATMLAGRVGSAMAAELGTMRVTEQIDALSALGTNPIQVLVVPRLVTCVLLIPLLTGIADCLGIFGGHLISTQLFAIDTYYYWYYTEKFVEMSDLAAGLVKSIFFGYSIGIIACHRGFHSKAGAQGVGQAATESFVLSFVIILAVDLVVGSAWNSVYRALYPEVSEGLI